MQEPGVGITLNMLYLNAYLWGFQWPLVQDMAKSGTPFESITVAAGVPYVAFRIRRCCPSPREITCSVL
jgi:enoyl reductase-like protein